MKAVSTNQTYNTSQHAKHFLLDKNFLSGTRPTVAAEVHVDTAPATAVQGDSDDESDSEVEPVDGDTAEGERPPPPANLQQERDVEEEVATDDFVQIHPADVTRSKRLSLILNTLKNLPGHKTTLILGDSNTHGVHGDKVDPENGTVAVRSFGGLCIVAAVHALQKYQFSHKNIKKLVWSLGTNDALHRNQHCPDDSVKYIKALYTESARVFPKATVAFILPFAGIKGVSDEFRKDLDDVIKENCPKMKRHYPPSMRNKFDKGGVHINFAGKRAYVEFLMKHFTKCKPQQQYRTTAGPTTHEHSVGGSAQDVRGRENVRDNFRVNLHPTFSEQQVPPQLPTTLGAGQRSYAAAAAAPLPPAAAPPVHPSFIVRDIAEALTHIMMMRRHGPQQPYNVHGQWG